MANSSSLRPSAAIPVGGARVDPTTLGTTPGGTLFGTTPGGTRVVYSKDALLELSRSPLSKSTPKGLKEIPGVTVDKSPKLDKPPTGPTPANSNPANTKSPSKPQGSDDVFEMDI